MELIINTETYHCPDVGDIAILSLCGPIDQQSVQVFESTVLELHQNEIYRIILDLTDTKYLNSTGLGLLINIAHKVNVVGGGIRLINVAEKFKVLFDMLGLETCLPILADQGEAVNSFGGNIADMVPFDNAEAQGQQEEYFEEEDEEDEEYEDDEEGEENIQFDNLLFNPAMTSDEQYISGAPNEEFDDEEYDDDDEKIDGVEEASFKFDNFLEEMSDKDEELEQQEQYTTEPEEKPHPTESSPITPVMEEKEEEKPAQEKTEKKPTFLKKTLADKIQETRKKEEENLAVQAIMADVKIDPPKAPVIEAAQPPTPVIAIAEPVIKTPQQAPVKTWKMLRRRSIVRYYNRVNSNKTYPMSVILEDKAPPSEQEQEILTNPTLVVIPRFPGCQVEPKRIAMDVSSSKAVSEFWITPFTQGSPQGNIPGWIEVWYEGKIKEHFPTPFRIVKSTLTKITFVCTLVFALLGVAIDRWQPDMELLPTLLAQLVQLTEGWRPLGIICGAIFALLTVVFFLKFHDREALPIEKTSDLKLH